MLTPENSQEKHEQAEARAKELRSTIVRAKRIEELFASTEEAEADFRTTLVDAHRFYYKKDDPDVEYVIEAHPDGDIHRVTRNGTHPTTFQRLVNGDVNLIFYYPDKSPSVQLITPEVGNINHPFTRTDVVTPDAEVVDSLLEDLSLEANGISLVLLLSHLRGKPATQGWEDTMLYGGHIPQRIGYRLFPDYALNALAKLRQEYPQFVVMP